MCVKVTGAYHCQCINGYDISLSHFLEHCRSLSGMKLAKVRAKPQRRKKRNKEERYVTDEGSIKHTKESAILWQEDSEEPANKKFRVDIDNNTITSTAEKVQGRPCCLHTSNESSAVLAAEAELNTDAGTETAGGAGTETAGGAGTETAALGQRRLVALGQRRLVALGQRRLVALGQRRLVALGQRRLVALGQRWLVEEKYLEKMCG